MRNRGVFAGRLRRGNAIQQGGIVLERTQKKYIIFPVDKKKLTYLSKKHSIEVRKLTLYKFSQ